MKTKNKLNETIMKVECKLNENYTFHPRPGDPAYKINILFASTAMICYIEKL